MSRRLLPSLFLLLVLATTALAQLTIGERQEVLRAMDRVLSERAFVPGVDLTKWPEYLKARSQHLDQADTHDRFARVVNSALREFGISHINIARSTPAPRRPGAELFALQDPRGAMRQDTLNWLDDDTAVIRINTFGSAYRSRAIDELFSEASGAKFLVLDLRGNPGGILDNMHHLLGYLLPNNAPVGTFISRRMARAYVEAGQGDGTDPLAIARWADSRFRVRTRNSPFEGQIAVLVDRGSGSAAEIVASALRENREAVIVGTPTAGAVLVSVYDRLPHGFRIQYPISDYVSIRGVRLEGNPLVPDIQLPPTQARTAAAAQAAADRLRSGPDRRQPR
jgi:hypothetical protein